MRSQLFSDNYDHFYTEQIYKNINLNKKKKKKEENNENEKSLHFYFVIFYIIHFIIIYIFVFIFCNNQCAVLYSMQRASKLFPIDVNNFLLLQILSSLRFICFYY